ncbi:hypothetical protein [Sphingomicrobium arenosum]|uniref:hypothetical protein n=1 Tax=Sphingomicrobium arenosum TaxID=2233861 RepID=UPI0022401CE7|nr:hypothetical protein [Sphingomicrobium arenosum]
MSRDEFSIFALVAVFLGLLLVGGINHWIIQRSPPGKPRHRRLVSLLVVAALGIGPTLWAVDNANGWRSVDEGVDRFFALPGIDMPEPRWDHRYSNRCASDREQNLALFLDIEGGELPPATRAALPGRLLAYLADYHDVSASGITIHPGALDWHRLGPWDYDRDRPMYPRRYTRITSDHVCASVNRSGDDVELIRCNPVDDPNPRGSAGYVLAVHDDVRDRLDIELIHAKRAPYWCENPIRERVNALLGLPHPG